MGPSENPEGCWGNRGDILQRPVRVCRPGPALRGQRQLFPLRSQVPAVFQLDPGRPSPWTPKKIPPPSNPESQARARLYLHHIHCIKLGLRGLGTDGASVFLKTPVLCEQGAGGSACRIPSLRITEPEST